MNWPNYGTRTVLELAMPDLRLLNRVRGGKGEVDAGYLESRRHLRKRLCEVPFARW
jgi:hypothetical protein